MENRARALVRDLAESFGEVLDDPVVDYLAGLLVSTVLDGELWPCPDIEIETLAQTFEEFIPKGGNLKGHITHALSSVKNMDHEQDPVHPSNPMEPTMNQIDQVDDVDGGMGKDNSNLQNSVVNRKLNVNAVEFVPGGVCLDQSDLESAENVGLDLLDDLQQMGIGNYEWDDDTDNGLNGQSESHTGHDMSDPYATVDSIGLLMCLFPTFSKAALQSLLQVHSGNVQACIQTLGTLSVDAPEVSKPVEEPVAVDLSESSFPALPVTSNSYGKNSAKAARGFRGGEFAAAVKKQLVVNETGPVVRKKGSVNRVDDFSGRRVEAGVIPWVETGQEVTKLYNDMRDEASEHARRRNAYFTEATQAYLAGNKALAKELGSKGRWHCDRMKDCHAMASEAIFQQRNAKLNSGRGPFVVDLHGLHVTEAKRILSRELGRLKSSRRTVNLLVGTGHHTKGSRTPPRLPGAVKDFLAEEGYTHRMANPGVIEVKLR